MGNQEDGEAVLTRTWRRLRMPLRGRRGWRGRSRLSQVDIYTRVTLYAMPWLALVSVPGPFAEGLRRASSPVALAQILVVVIAVQSVVAKWGIQRGLDHYLRGAEVPRRLLGALVALGLAAVSLTLTLEMTGGFVKARTVAQVLPVSLVPLFCVVCLMVPVRVFAAGTAGVTAAAGGVVTATSGYAMALATCVVSVFIAFFCQFTMRCSAWMLAVMWELEDARDVQARLAVAEERLRFGRDLHDVLGRNLAVIALKSELAVRLAEGGRPESAEQMAEVQRIAQESQREVRAVVRGYREADLHTELAGARGVLRAAGVNCRIEGDGGRALPEAVQSALAWVVREGTTNVLRHADARACTVRVRVRNTAPDGGRGSGTAVLLMENDGVPAGASAPAGAGGSGLAGLRERLTAVGGTVAAEPLPGGRFRLTAEIPLAERAPRTEGERTGGPRPGPAPVEGPAAGDGAETGQRDVPARGAAGPGAPDGVVRGEWAGVGARTGDAGERSGDTHGE